ncbi:MAG: hypothetical protein DI585_04890 [Pseudomonas fluorescens]|nr:MAG: hypothetical protein DI585_04890 [Pseudomonas fluorescens]
MWGEALADDGGFERIVVLASGDIHVDFKLLLGQMWPRLRPDGLLVIVAARPSPWGVRNTVWWRGYPLRRWKRWLKSTHWLFADDVTVGFSGAWAKLIPVIGGPVRVILAQKRVGGTKILTIDKTGKVVAKPVGVPV